jgi:hypothetical protein
MTAPSYTTDLQTVSLANGTTGWAELSGHTSGGAATDETTYYIQDTQCVSQSTGVATGTTTGLQYDYGSNITWTSGWCFFAWQIYLAPGAIDTWANGGLRFGVGSSAGNMNFWKVIGNDFGRNPYGGWQNNAVDPTFTADYTDGSPVTGNYRYFGSNPNLLSAVNKGNPHGVDAIRYGRGQLLVIYGESSNYATFAGMATANDGTSARWGLFQRIGVAYLWKGLLSIGSSGTAVDFRDANRVIQIDDTPRTYAAFNKIEINNASSNVEWENVQFQAVNASQLSRGAFEMVANATVALTSCSFTDMDTFIFQSNADVAGTTFRRCLAVTGGGATFLGCIFAASSVAADASAFIWNTNANLDGILDNATFSKGTNAHHAITLGTSAPTTHTLRGITFTGFNASDGQNDSVLYLADRGTDTAWTINASGCSGTVSYKKARSGDTVTVNVDQVTLTIEVRDSSGTLITDSTEITLVRSSDTTVLHHAESVTTGSTGYTYGYSGDVTCYVNVLSVDNYVPRTVEPVILGDTDQTVVVQLEDERGRYNNP